MKFCPTQRAPDGWDAPRFKAVRVAGSWSRQNGVLSSRPPAGNASRWLAFNQDKCVLMLLKTLIMATLRIDYKYPVLILLFLTVSCGIPPTEQAIPPTMSSTQVAETTRKLYTDNGGCNLPCLWGIDPGKTTIQDVYNRFSKIGSFRDITRSVDVLTTIAFTTSPPRDLVSIYDDDKWSFLMRVKNDVVVGLVSGVTVIQESSAPSLATFLAYFGKPEQIWVMIIESPGENPDYAISLYYPSKGVFIRWRGNTDSVVTQTDKKITVIACPQHIPTEADTYNGLYPPFFYLFDPDESMTFNEIIKTHLSEDTAGSYQLLDSTELEKFYTLYLDPTAQDCFPLSYSW